MELVRELFVNEAPMGIDNPHEETCTFYICAYGHCGSLCLRNICRMVRKASSFCRRLSGTCLWSMRQDLKSDVDLT